MKKHGNGSEKTQKGRHPGYGTHSDTGTTANTSLSAGETSRLVVYDEPPPIYPGPPYGYHTGGAAPPYYDAPQARPPSYGVAGIYDAPPPPPAPVPGYHPQQQQPFQNSPQYDFDPNMPMDEQSRLIYDSFSNPPESRHHHQNHRLPYQDVAESAARGGVPSEVFDVPPLPPEPTRTTSSRNNNSPKYGSMQTTTTEDADHQMLLYGNLPPPTPDGTRPPSSSRHGGHRRAQSAQEQRRLASPQEDAALYTPVLTSPGSRFVMPMRKRTPGGLPPVSPGFRSSPHDKSRKTYPPPTQEEVQKAIAKASSSSTTPDPKRAQSPPGMGGVGGSAGTSTPSSSRHRRASSTSDVPFDGTQSAAAQSSNSTMYNKSIRSSGVGAARTSKHRRANSTSNVPMGNSSSPSSQALHSALHSKAIRSSGVTVPIKKRVKEHRRSISLSEVQQIAREEFYSGGTASAFSPLLQTTKKGVRASSTDDFTMEQQLKSSLSFSKRSSTGSEQLDTRHRRIGSGSSFMSSANSVMSGGADSVVTDIKKSKFFKVNAETGDVHLHLPIDNIRITMDPDLEPGTIYKQREDNEAERFFEYQVASDRLSGNNLLDSSFSGLEFSNNHVLGGGPGHSDACACTCTNCVHCSDKRELLPDPRYVINVDGDLYKRVISEIADSRNMPCGLYYCGHHEDVETPSIYIAAAIVLLVFIGMYMLSVFLGEDGEFSTP